jgi:hypothetical protein
MYLLVISETILGKYHTIHCLRGYGLFGWGCGLWHDAEFKHCQVLEELSDFMLIFQVGYGLEQL